MNGIKRVDRKYFDWISEKFGIQRQEDWYSIDFSELKQQLGSRHIEQKYGGSFIRALKTVYDEFKWQEWRFDRVQNGFWKEQENQREYFLWLADELQISDWSKVTAKDIRHHRGAAVISCYYSDSVQRAISTLFPSLSSEAGAMQTVTPSCSIGQSGLSKMLKRMFSVPLLLNYKHPELLFAGNEITVLFNKEVQHLPGKWN